MTGYKKVAAHITGTVWKVEVQIDDEVREEDVLVILESMKMEMPVEAPCDGIVRAILVTPGQSVDEGQVLVEIEPT